MEYIINIYVRPADWFASLTQICEYGADLKVNVNKESMDDNLYAKGWEDYASKWRKEENVEVNIHHLDLDTKELQK